MIIIQFTNQYYFELFEVFGHKIYLTQTLLSTWVVMGILIALAVIVRVRVLKFGAVPKGFQSIVEIAVEAMDKFTITTMGEEYRNFGGFFFGMFAFIILANYCGLLGLRPPTADMATTAALAITIFIVIHSVGIAKNKLGYFKAFVKPNVIFLPINLIGEVSNVLSLCFRLFGNMLGGVIIMSLVYDILPLLLKVGLPAALHAYFDVFAGALQAYIFTVLSMTFITAKGTG